MYTLYTISAPLPPSRVALLPFAEARVSRRNRRVVIERAAAVIVMIMGIAAAAGA
jgi:hypothetical protein